jgi:5-methylcytosine-specific restriction endonuclease McrA
MIKALWCLCAIIPPFEEIAMKLPVLVLNANYEPINISNTHRALTLIMAGKANLVLNGRGYIYTVQEAFPCPSVIRLSNMVRRPRPHVKLTKREILRRDNYSCQYCGAHSTTLTIDHIIPRHMGGGHTWENLVTACQSCNHRKGGKTPEQVHMLLLRKPTEPPTSANYIFARHLNQYREWIPFIEGW